jgi:hypothetical protein
MTFDHGKTEIWATIKADKTDEKKCAQNVRKSEPTKKIRTERLISMS